jgi:sulfur carrier protein
MRIFVNGAERDLADGATLASLVQELGLEPRYVAVEVNLVLVPRAQHGNHVLQAGDRLEVVTLVGGG